MLSPGQVVAFVLFDLALILVAARTFGALAKRVGQPGVVGEIIAGVILGPSVFGLLAFAPELVGDGGALAFLSCDVHTTGLPPAAAGAPANPEPSLSSCLFPAQARGVLGNIGQLALLLFMFLVGVELDLKQLTGKLGQIGIVAVGVVALPILIGVGIAPLLDKGLFANPEASDLGFALFVGCLLSVTALPVMARVLQEKGLATTPLGIVGVAASAAVTVLMFIAAAVSAGIAQEASTGEILKKVALSFLYVGVMMTVVKALVDRLLGEPYRQRATARGQLRDDSTWSQQDEFAVAGVGHTLTHGMFAWTMVLVLASGWVAHVLGINVIVGGFMAGLILPAREGIVRDMTEELFDVVVILFLPVFLAFAGLTADFTQLSGAALPGLLLFLVAGVVAKWGGSILFGRMAGLPMRDANLLGILMNCRGLLVLVVGLVGLQAGVISPVLNVAVVAMALITTAMTGPLFDRFSKDQPAPASPAPDKPVVSA